MGLLVLLAVLGMSTAYFAHPDKHNKVEEWPDDLDFSNDDILWPVDTSRSRDRQVYQWVENDVVEKLRTDSDGLLHLPGGCEITHEQYQRLKDFRRDADYVQNCYCQDGGVYCKLRKSGSHVQIT